jgi:hypothetical protein
VRRRRHVTAWLVWRVRLTLYSARVDFRSKLLATLRAVQPVLEVPGVLVVGSELPNLLQPGAASTLVVSQDVDLAVPVDRHHEVKERLRGIQQLRPAPEEPSVRLPSSDALIEVNLLGLDRRILDAADSYVLEDDELPLMVFGLLSLLEPGRVLDVEGVPVPIPKPSGLIVEKLLTDRSGIKGDRDLLVVAGLLETSTPTDIDEVIAIHRRLPDELRHAAVSNLTVLSLMTPHPNMPDPTRHRLAIAALLTRVERGHP